MKSWPFHEVVVVLPYILRKLLFVMNSTVILAGSAISLLLIPILIDFSFHKLFKQGKKRTNNQVNKVSAFLLTGIILGIPAVWAISVLIVSGFSYLSPVGHLYLWGSIGVLAILVGSFAGIRQLVIKSEGTL